MNSNHNIVMSHKKFKMCMQNKILAPKIKLKKNYLSLGKISNKANLICNIQIMIFKSKNHQNKLKRINLKRIII